MTDKKKPDSGENDEPKRGKSPRDSKAPDPSAGPAAGGVESEDGDTASVESADDLFATEGPDVESLTDEDISFLEEGERDLLADMRNDLARAQAELVNFRKRVERDRAANREAVIAEVIRTLLPALDDMTRAEAHGDLAGSPLELVAQKLHAGFARYGLRSVGEKGEPFDPHLHEALVQLPSPDVTVNTVADVIESGYALGDRLIRAAKVAVSVPDSD
jgi:molecular chaperone GrpE